MLAQADDAGGEKSRVDPDRAAVSSKAVVTSPRRPRSKSPRHLLKNNRHDAHTSFKASADQTQAKPGDLALNVLPSDVIPSQSFLPIVDDGLEDLPPWDQEPATPPKQHRASPTALHDPVFTSKSGEPKQQPRSRSPCRPSAPYATADRASMRLLHPPHTQRLVHSCSPSHAPPVTIEPL